MRNPSTPAEGNRFRTTDDRVEETAAQYPLWALEQIEEAGNQKAARHVRMALEALRKGTTDWSEPLGLQAAD